VRNVKKDEPYFLEVNVNDPFFQQINYTLQGPGDSDFKDFGLKAATFQMRYNNNLYTADSAFSEPGGKFEKQISRSKEPDELFDVRKEYIFKSEGESGIAGPSSSNLEVKSISNLETLDPSEFLDIARIRMRLDKNISWNDYDEIDVEISYDDGSSVRTKEFVFADGDPKLQEYKCRVVRVGEPWKIKYKITYYAADGSMPEKEGIFEGRGGLIKINVPTAS